MEDQVEVYLEVSPKRTFAGALEWPGWSRSGKDEQQALEALAAYGPRYKRAIGPVGRRLALPKDSGHYRVSERLPGNGSTDFGVPGRIPSFDEQPLDPPKVKFLERLLQECWKTFDKAAEAASSKELTKGPRGGGRQLEAIVAHVTDSEKSYLKQLGGKFIKAETEDLPSETARLRKTILAALRRRAAGKLSDPASKVKSPWPPRYFVRRDAWHILDHLWEIEDRSTASSGSESDDASLRTDQ